jgi:predicted RNA-binding protein with PUA-like domain
MKYWLMKSEPSELSIDDLKARPRGIAPWDGVRNYQARNYMRDDMKKGDQILFYHSSCPEPGVVGIAQVVREAYPDHTAFDPKSHYFDPKSSQGKVTWMMVDVKFIRKLKHIIGLQELKADPRLDGFALTRRGNRLSVMPVTKQHWDVVLGLE